MGARRVPHPGRRRDRAGPAVRARLVPVPGGRRRRRCGDRRVRRRRRVRGRQGRTAGSGRVPRVHHQRATTRRRGPKPTAACPVNPAAADGRHRPEHAGRARRAQRGDVHAAVSSTSSSRPRSAPRSTTRPRCCSPARPRPKKPQRRSPPWPAADRSHPISGSRCARLPPATRPALRRDSSTELAPTSPRTRPLRARRAPGRARSHRRPASAWPMIVAVPAAGAALYGLFVLYPIVQSTRYSLYDWNGLEPLDDFVGLDNFRRAFDDPVFRGAMRHNGDHHRAVAAAPDPGRARPGGAAQPADRAAGRCCARCSSPRTCCPRSSPASCGARSCAPTGCSTRASRRSAPAGSCQEWLADPDIVLYSLFFVISWKYFGFHMILLLAGLQQIPKELGEAAAIDGASAWQTLPPRHAAAARPDHPGVDLPLDHRRPAAVRPRLGDHQGRPDRRVVDDGDLPLRPVPQGAVRLRQRGLDRDLRPLARRRAARTSGCALRRDLQGTGLVG